MTLLYLITGIQLTHNTVMHLFLLIISNLIQVSTCMNWFNSSNDKTQLLCPRFPKSILTNSILRFLFEIWAKASVSLVVSEQMTRVSLENIVGELITNAKTAASGSYKKFSIKYSQIVVSIWSMTGQISFFSWGVVFGL